MRYRAVSLLGVMALAGAALVVAHLMRARVHVGGPDPATRLSLAEIDHAPFDTLLQKYVDDRGLVAYAAWKASSEDGQALDDYLARLGGVDLRAEASPSVRLAYWINAYNALTIKGILREYPTSSIRNHTLLVGGYNIWRDLLLTIDGQPHSLDDIEHRVLRKLGEPRIHFAIVCAAKGCPPLRNRAYTGTDLKEQLAGNARRFFSSADNFQADPATNTVFISELLKWYGEDFAPTPIEQLRVLRPYFPQPDKLKWIDTNDVTIEYLGYDWALNDQSFPR